MKKLCLILFCILLISSCEDNPSNFPEKQKYGIEGKILFDATNSDIPIRDAAVTLNGFSDTTGSSGYFYFRYFIAGKYQLTVQHDLFFENSQTINVPEQLDYNVYLALIPNEHFPNSPGSKWIYQTYDSSNGAVDNFDRMSVKIVGTELHPSGNITSKWNYKSGEEEWDEQYYTVKDTVFLYNQYSSTRFTKYIFPFYTGKSWYYFINKMFVINKVSVSTPAGLFENCYELYIDQTYIPHENNWEKLWYCDSIGIVKKQIFRSGWGGSKVSYWELIDYQIIK